jgi:hypothetical protein
VDAFAKRYLGDLPSYSLEVLCKHCGICVKKAWRYLQNKIHVEKGDFHPFFGRTEYQQYIKGNGIKNPRSSAAGSSIPFTLSDARALPGEGKKKRSVNKIVFWQIVWVRLQEFGWTMVSFFSLPLAGWFPRVLSPNTIFNRTGETDLAIGIYVLRGLLEGKGLDQGGTFSTAYLWYSSVWSRTNVTAFNRKQRSL